MNAASSVDDQGRQTGPGSSGCGWRGVGGSVQRWYLIHTKPLGEETARANLERQGYHLYLPRFLSTVRRRRRWLERPVPLFPRYLFLGLDEGLQSLKPVHSTLGVSAVVRFGLRYAVVPQEIVGALRARADCASGVHQLRRPVLVPGMPVTMIDGLFSGLEGVFERENGKDRVMILLALLGRQVSVQVSIDEFVPLTRAA